MQLQNNNLNARLTAIAERNQLLTKPPLQLSTRHYFGFCETEFKTRFYNHRLPFKDQRNINAAELFKAVSYCKNRGIKSHIPWPIVCKATAFKSGTKCCNLCLTEKLAVLQADQRTLLNKQSCLWHYP